MKKVVVMGMALCVALAFSACKSSESAYKKAYEKAKQQELAEAAAATEAPAEAPAVEAAPVVETAPAPVAPAPVREEKVELVSGDGLKAYSVVCGSFGIKANADGLKGQMDGEGYNAKVVYNAEKNMYRVIVASYDTHEEASAARDAFKAKYPDRKDFQGAWLLYAK